ncbi:MAG TPA: NAD(P)H-binding protein [Candidatus Saccharimonadales bacterium]
MQITIFGASGKVGSLVVAQALKQGYSVVAFVHSRSRLPENPNLRTVKGDIYNAQDVAKAVAGSKAVISALGSWGTPKKDVLTVAMRHIIPAVQSGTRIISLTGSDARADGDSLSLLHRLSHASIKLVPGVKKILADGEEHIHLLEASGLDWTVIRSPVMNERGNPEHATLTDKRPAPWGTINRHAVAASLVDLIDNGQYSRQAPFIART